MVLTIEFNKKLGIYEYYFLFDFMKLYFTIIHL